MIEVETAVVYDQKHEMRIADLLRDPSPILKTELAAMVDVVHDDAWEEWSREQDQTLWSAITKQVLLDT